MIYKYIQAGDKTAVFVTSQPQKIPLHNFYEFIWLLKTGLPRFSINIHFFPRLSKLFNLYLFFQRVSNFSINTFFSSKPFELFNIYYKMSILPRMARILAGKEPFIYDPNILKEKYQHYTP